MRISRFVGRGVNGYLDFNVRFHRSLTFVTGINGTGKTTAINSIIALLLPKIDYLCSQTFETLQLDIFHADEKIRLEAFKEGTDTGLRCSLHPNDEVIFEPFDDYDSVSPHRLQEHIHDFFQEQLSRHAKNPVMTFFDELPIPMFLGLDRRSISFELDRITRPPPPLRARRPIPHGIFGRTLRQSLVEALVFANRRFQDDRRQETRINAKFRNSLVLELLDFPPISFTGDLVMPSDTEIRSINSSRRNLQRLPELLNLPPEIISERVDPIFDFLEAKVKTLNLTRRNRRRRKRATEPEEIEGDRMYALLEWSFNKAQVTKINKISDIISSHSNEILELFSRSSSYFEAVNQFFEDSGKTLQFDPYGELVFTTTDGTDVGISNAREVTTLSSGEIQLLVIFTHLYFNPEVQRASVFIVDEPELSLHVQWQEKFVDAVISASPDTQFILATHSPSIILDKVKHCVELPIRK